jgi:hypothetical protein
MVSDYLLMVIKPYPEYKEALDTYLFLGNAIKM